jgi:uncharacterized protein (DUF58 family)
MPTRQGWLALITGIATIVSARLFGVLELYVIGITILAAVLVAVVTVRLRPLRMRITRRVTPRRVHAGEQARVELIATNRAKLRTPMLALRNPVSSTQGAQLQLAPLSSGRTTRAAYRLPTRRRGFITIGPLRLTRGDVLGLASRTVEAAPATTVIVLPQWFRVAVPGFGGDQGPLGQHLRMRALGRAGEEFRSLRDYVPGDDLRRINWKASARAETFKVRENETAAMRNMAVVLDQGAGLHSAESFERAISSAASIVLSASEAERDVRFATSLGHDLSPATTGMEPLLEHLAMANPAAQGSVINAVGALGSRLTGGVLVLVGGRIDHATMNALRGAAGADAAVAVACEGPVPPPMPGVFVVDASSEAGFVAGWNMLVGARSTALAPTPTEPTLVSSAPVVETARSIWGAR